MTSAWDILEQKVVATIQGVSGTGNAHRYLPEFEHSSLLSDYYLAEISGAKKVRAWYAFVEQALDFNAISTISVRMTCRVGAWYEKGINGSGIQLLKQHVSLVQGGLKALGYDLDNTVSLVESWGTVTYGTAAVPVEKVEGSAVTAEWSFECIRGMSEA